MVLLALVVGEWGLNVSGGGGGPVVLVLGGMFLSVVPSVSVREESDMVGGISGGGREITES